MLQLSAGSDVTTKPRRAEQQPRIAIAPCSSVAEARGFWSDLLAFGVQPSGGALRRARWRRNLHKRPRPPRRSRGADEIPLGLRVVVVVALAAAAAVGCHLRPH